MEDNDAFQQQMQEERNRTDVAFLQGQQDRPQDSILNKHLEPTQMLEQVEYLLKGYEYDSDNEEWKTVKIPARDERTGQIVEVEQGPIIDPNYVRMTIGYLKIFLNSNVYLSYIEQQEQVNSIMWDVKKKLVILLHPLKKKYDSRMIDVIGSMIENPIYLALLRAYKKNTLDAFSKVQTSVEHIGNQPQKQPQQEQKKFKIFGL